MRKVKKATFNGRKYKIDIGDGRIDGQCDQYAVNENSRTLMVAAPISTRTELEAIIHEALHASNWKWPERLVERVAREIARLLWRLGYRRPVEREQ